MTTKAQTEAPPPSAPITPGLQTSELWTTMVMALLSLGGQLEGAIPAPWGGIVAGVLSLGYTLARTFLKAQALPTVIVDRGD